MQTNDSSNQVKPDEFRVGDTVWDLAFGKGKVTAILLESTYPIEVTLDNGIEYCFTHDGKFVEHSNRTLFFSEPKIEASVTRPFVPTLVGKRVAVQYYDETWTESPVVITAETEDQLFTKDGDTWKSDLIAVYEVSPENLLKP